MPVVIIVLTLQMPSVRPRQLFDKEPSNASGIEGHQRNASSVSLFDHLLPNLVTLSLLPKSQWQSLTNLDIIKVHNKPIEPPKKPEKAPFFLPSTPSLSGDISFKAQMSAASEEETKRNDEISRCSKTFDLSSPFLVLLQSCAETRNSFTDYIKSLSPSVLDVELRMLQIIDNENTQELQKRPELHYIGVLLDYLTHKLVCRNNFEFIQAVIRLFLKMHGEILRSQPLLQEKAKKLLEFQTQVWQKIDNLFQTTRCMVMFLSNSQF